MPRDARRSPYEAAENLCYFVSALVFAGASTLYLHGYVSKAARIRGEEMGAWSFVAGSVGFMLASFVNALGLASAAASAAGARAARRARDRAARRARDRGARGARARLHAVRLGVFRDGLVLYRPALTTHCDTAALDDEEPCVSAYNEGTALYLVGSLLFLLQSAVHLSRRRSRTATAARARLRVAASARARTRTPRKARSSVVARNPCAHPPASAAVRRPRDSYFKCYLACTGARAIARAGPTRRGAAAGVSRAERRPAGRRPKGRAFRRARASAAHGR